MENGWEVTKVFTSVAFLALGTLFSTSETSGFAQADDDHDGYGGGYSSRLATGLKLAHLLSFSTAWGVALWVTFSGGFIMFWYLPRHLFGNLRGKIFKVYFTLEVACCAMSVACFGYLHPWSSCTTSSEDRYQLQILISCLLLNLSILIIFLPILVKICVTFNNFAKTVMKQRHKVERALNIGKEAGWARNREVAKVNPELAVMNAKFAIIHALSSLSHVMSMATLAMHLWYLASKFNL